MIPTPPSDTARLPHLPALDGVRGFAVIAVLLFHSEFTWARGGHLGVTTFFVLSGFLITSLLLLEHAREGRVSLAAFWGRRARRLVPAALLAVALGGLYLGYGAAAGAPGAGRSALLDGISALFWFANWRFILDGQSYGDLFAEPSPFRHFWSLAIEEQFYVVLPLVVVGVLALSSTRRAARWALGAVLGVLVVGSTEWVALLHSPGDLPLRTYYGTDTRLAEPALGALLAVLLVGGGQLRLAASVAVRRVADGAAVACLGGLVLLMSRLSVHDSSLYDGGLLLAAVCAAVIVAAATQGGVVSRVLSVSPLAGLGRISYGVYLFHWPIFLWLDEAYTGLSGARLLFFRSVVTLTLALASYAIVEQPLRLGRLSPRVGGLAWANGLVAVVAGLAVLTGAVAWPIDGAGRSVEVASGFTSSSGAAPPAPSRTTTRPRQTQAVVPAAPAAQPPAGVAGEAAPVSAPEQATTPARQQTAPSGRAPERVLTRYRVAFIGDSVAQNLAYGMMRWGQSAGIETLDLTEAGCPISRGGQRRFSENLPWDIAPHCAWWEDPDSDRWVKLREFVPDVIILHDGLNEIPDRKLDEWPKWMRPGEPVFDTWLTGEYRALIDAVAAQRIGLLLLNVPCADWKRSYEFGQVDGADSRVTALNTTVYHEIGTSATKVLDLFRYMCPNGKYSDTVDGISNARPDGFHLSDPAADRAAERLLAPAVRQLADDRRAGTTPSP